MRKRPRLDADIAFATEEGGVKMTPQEASDVETNAPLLVSSNRNTHKHHNAIPGRIKLAVLLVGIIFIAGVVCVKLSSRAGQPVHFACPSHVHKSANDISSENQEYERVTNEIMRNMTGYLQTFSNSTFDSWGRTYERVKRGMYHWKRTRVAPFVENGDSIYESACGIGMNLRMTLEILHEVRGIDFLRIYGNEYVPLSAQVANRIWDEHALWKAQKGTICAADSAILDFVPSDSFHLVYTGYIT